MQGLCVAARKARQAKEKRELEIAYVAIGLSLFGKLHVRGSLFVKNIAISPFHQGCTKRARGSGGSDQVVHAVRCPKAEYQGKYN